MFFKVNFGFKSLRTICAVAAFSLLSFPNAPVAQTLSSQAGSAVSVNLVAAAQDLPIQNAYVRSLMSFLRANPAVLNDQQFYVNLVSYLLSTQIGTDCRNAFANEFERRDFFTRSFEVLPQVQQALTGKNIPQRFEVSFQVNTGEYDFTSGNLPFGSIKSVGEGLQASIYSDNGQYCAQQMLQGTNVDTKIFPWNFTVVNEAGERQAPGFPFERSLQLSSADARILFEQFGRQLYSIVGYQVLAAGDGSHRVQAVPTDAQLFGLSDNAVVRVKTYAHPALSQPNYLDIANELTLQSEPLNLDATVRLEQEGFRAVATGTAVGRGTGVTAASRHNITGSAAVGATSFIMRIAAPQLINNIPQLSNTPGSKRYLTIYGDIDFNSVTATTAPVIGRAVVLEVRPTGDLMETSAYPVSGHFTALADPQTDQVSSSDPSAQQQATGD